MTEAWPDLRSAGWLDTATTLQLWSQLVGKTRLAFEPMVNHWWQVALSVTPEGLSTGVLHDGDRAFSVELDLTLHALRLRDGTGRDRSFPLEDMSLATFYGRYTETLASIGVTPNLWPRAVEVPEVIDLERDEEQRAYDPRAAMAFMTAFRNADAVLKMFRAGFVGKASPVHFFWGGFDLAATRFSGRRAPLHPGGIPNCPDRVMHEAYSHEVSSAGFWLGSAAFPEAVFYSYAYPEPEGFPSSAVRPAGARYERTLGEFVLPYEAVRQSGDPRGAVLEFLQSTYEAAADLGRWDRSALER